MADLTLSIVTTSAFSLSMRVISLSCLSIAVGADASRREHLSLAMPLPFKFNAWRSGPSPLALLIPIWISRAFSVCFLLRRLASRWRRFSRSSLAALRFARSSSFFVIVQGVLRISWRKAVVSAQAVVSSLVVGIRARVREVSGRHYVPSIER